MRSASVLEFLVQRYQVDVTLFQQLGSPDPRSGFPPDSQGGLLYLSACDGTNCHAIIASNPRKPGRHPCARPH